MLGKIIAVEENAKYLTLLSLFVFQNKSNVFNRCMYPSIYLNTNGSGEVLYNVDFAIGGFQWTIDGTTVTLA